MPTLIVVMIATAHPALAQTSPVPPSARTALTSSPADHRAIEALLATYTRAVSTRNQSLFETLLLNKAIPFAYVPDDSAAVARRGTADYERFRKSVFEGERFTQTFHDVSIAQDGNLADVRLVFVNKEAHASSWGWKSMQLLKVDGAWKIASEFFTVHASSRD